MGTKDLRISVGSTSPLDNRALLDLIHLFNSDKCSIEDLKLLEGSINVAIFKKENNCSDEEFENWRKYNETHGKFFTVSLASYRGVIEEYVDDITKTSNNNYSVKVFDKEIPFRLFERYWRFLINANADYIGYDVFENKRATMHNTIFKYVGLSRISDSETKLGKEILRICDLLDSVDNTTLEKELEKIIKILSNEGNLIKK